MYHDKSYGDLTWFFFSEMHLYGLLISLLTYPALFGEIITPNGASGRCKSVSLFFCGRLILGAPIRGVLCIWNSSWIGIPSDKDSDSVFIPKWESESD